MHLHVFPTKSDMGSAAATLGAESIRMAIAERGTATIIVATGASQFEMLESLTQAPDIDWSKVDCFHLDEYVGISIDHPASFRRYLRERFVEKLPSAPNSFHYINAEKDPAAECERLSKLIDSQKVDAAFVGIGENGHLAFNDPPADFETETPYLVVQLDEACRKQQHGEGWFGTLDDVPKSAISMSIKQILKSKLIVCTVPDERKSLAVKNCVEGDVCPNAPASILQTHSNTHLYLDESAASKLANRHEL